MNLDPIAEIIAAANQGVVGKSLFLFNMPETCAKGVVLRLPVDGISVSQYLPGYYKTYFQAIVRDKSFASGQGRAEALSSLLTFYDRTFTDSANKPYLQIKICYPCVKPIVFPRMTDNLLEWSIKFDVVYVEL